jgi:DNA (cytosine-5)-methyltransferase 1
MGYSRAGFDVVGVDIKPQPNYPFEFICRDVMTLSHWFETSWIAEFDAVHASPPCQAFSSITRLGKTAGDDALDLICGTRVLLRGTGLPYVIENVQGAPLLTPTLLCGSSLGLGVRRHRLFETNFPLVVPPCSHGNQGRAIAVYGDHPQKTDRSPWRAETLLQGRDAMGIDWMQWGELTQAIPPAPHRTDRPPAHAAHPGEGGCMTSRMRAYLDPTTHVERQAA